MEMTRDMLIDQARIKLAVRDYTYRSLMDVVKRECGQRLPIPLIYFMEWKIDKHSLKFWLKIDSLGPSEEDEVVQ